jgi:hypothetical protein
MKIRRLASLNGVGASLWKSQLGALGRVPPMADSGCAKEVKDERYYRMGVRFEVLRLACVVLFTLLIPLMVRKR